MPKRSGPNLRRRGSNHLYGIDVVRVFGSSGHHVLEARGKASGLDRSMTCWSDDSTARFFTLPLGGLALFFQ